jgi:hypothetical protein
MAMEMRQLLPPHPSTHHHSFSEIHKIEEQSLQVQSAQAEYHLKAAPVAEKVSQESEQMSIYGAGEAVAFDTVCARSFRRFIVRQSVLWTIRWIDGGSLNANAQGAKCQDFPQDKHHRQGRIGTDQVGEGDGRGC